MNEFDKLIDIVKKLRAPDGCPWDRKQTLYSLKDALIEETCELIDALDNKDIENIKEELGDVLLHVVFHSQTACEDGLFNIEDVICGINEKLIRRHPHVFKNEHYETAEQVKERWDEIKKEENKDKTAPDSILDKVPKSLPSLMQAEKLQKKASKYGFDWENPEQVFKKLQEELNELHDAYKEKNKEHISEELGDVIFVLSRLATTGPQRVVPLRRGAEAGEGGGFALCGKPRHHRPGQPELLQLPGGRGDGGICLQPLHRGPGGGGDPVRSPDGDRLRLQRPER